MMARRTRLVLLDAGAVFAALEHEAWGALTGGYQVVIPRIDLDEIQFYYSRDTGRKVFVNPESWVEDGTIRGYAAQATDGTTGSGAFDVHEGVIHGLAHVSSTRGSILRLSHSR